MYAVIEKAKYFLAVRAKMPECSLSATSSQERVGELGGAPTLIQDVRSSVNCSLPLYHCRARVHMRYRFFMRGKQVNG